MNTTVVFDASHGVYGSRFREVQDVHSKVVFHVLLTVVRFKVVTR
jgi:hypothetical protein